MLAKMHGRQVLQQPLASELVDESEDGSTTPYQSFPASIQRWEGSVAAVEQILDVFEFGGSMDPPPDVGPVVVDSKAEHVSLLREHSFGRVNRLLAHHKTGCSWRIGLRRDRRPDAAPRRLPDAGLFQGPRDSRRVPVVVEATNASVLPPSTDVVAEYHRGSRMIQKAICQLTAHIGGYGTRLGILSSFHYTYLVEASQDADWHVHLRISEPLQWSFPTAGLPVSTNSGIFYLSMMGEQAEDRWPQGGVRDPVYLDSAQLDAGQLGKELGRNAGTAVVCCSYAGQTAVAKVALEDDEEAEYALEQLSNELRVYQDLASLQGDVKVIEEDMPVALSDSLDGSSSPPPERRMGPPDLEETGGDIELSIMHGGSPEV